MVPRHHIPRIFKIASYITVASFLLVGLVSFRAVRNSVGRANYSGEKIELIKQDALYLENELGAKKVSFKTSDGVTLSGYLFVRPNAHKNILICHGYKSSKELLANYVRLFPKDNVLIFDFRAHGESSGSIISFGYHEKNDVVAAAHYLEQQKKTRGLPLYGVGVSMGGAILLAAEQAHPLFRALVIDSAFASFGKQIERSFHANTGLPHWFFRSSANLLYEYMAGITVNDINPVEYVRNIHIPILFIHAANDDEIPVEDSYIMYASANDPKKIWVVPECPHGALCKNYFDEYRKTVTDFFAGRLTK